MPYSRNRVVWVVPVTLYLSLLFIASLNLNSAFFVEINQISRYTGDPLWSNITIIGDALIAIAIALPLFGRRPDIIWAIIIASILAILIVHCLKPLAQIARPPAVLPEHLIHVIGPAHMKNAFPSGHTAAIFTVVGAYCLLTHWSWTSRILLSMAIAAGLSRIVVGVHWPVDVLTGALTGWLCAFFGIMLARQWHWGLSERVQRSFAIIFTIATIYLVLFHNTKYPDAIILQQTIGIAALIVATPGLLRLFGKQVFGKAQTQ